MHLQKGQLTEHLQRQPGRGRQNSPRPSLHSAPVGQGDVQSAGKVCYQINIPGRASTGLCSLFTTCRLTAVTTPAVSKALGLEVAKREWIACGAALLGGLFITLDTALADNTAATDAALGIPLPFTPPCPRQKCLQLFDAAAARSARPVRLFSLSYLVYVIQRAKYTN